ncbi:MAG TPA: hypothetical protein VHO47_04740 [Candidatus Babeliales bacterium]|nr:hypothetical protein [Candidatus Babeliales bacterium]
MIFLKRFKLQFSLLALCAVSTQTLPVSYFERLTIETPSQATSALLALGATAACSLYCGRMAYDLIDAQNKQTARNIEFNQLSYIGNFFSKASNIIFRTRRQNPGNAGNPPQSVNYAPYIWSTISGFALLRSAVLARSLYDYCIKA